MESKRRLWIVVALLALGGGLLLVGGRGCEEAQEAVDAAADEITGNRAVQQGQEIERELRQITRLREEQLKEQTESEE